MLTKAFKIRLEQIKKSIKNGAQYAEDVADEIGLSIRTIIDYANRERIKLPPFRDQRNRYSERRNSVKDEIIREGLKLEDIAEEHSRLTNTEKVSHEAIRQYISATGQHEVWKQAKQERKKVFRDLISQVLSISGHLVSQIESTGLRNASEEERWAYKKTCEHFSKKKFDRGAYSFEQIFSLFLDYYKFKVEGEKVPLKWFAEKYCLWETVVGRIFKDVELTTFFWPNHKKRVKIPEYKKQVLEKAVEVEIPQGDIAYFLRIPLYVVSDYFNVCYKGDKKRPDVKKFIKLFGSNTRKFTLDYRTASQIYESRDLGFTKEETLELLNKKERVYDYAMQHRKEISDHIIRSLKIMFPDKEVRKPYINFSGTED